MGSRSVKSCRLGRVEDHPVPAARLSATHLSALQASVYLCPEDLLRGEVEESQRKLHVVVDTLSFFKQLFQDRRENLHSYFKENQEVREWDFQSSLVFVRLDGFLGRLGMVQVSVLLPSGPWFLAGGSSLGIQKVAAATKNEMSSCAAS